MKAIFYTLSLFAFSFSVKAQDPNFSQFFASPLTLNPAMTGKFDGLYRVAGNYRNQWPTINNAFVTYTASFDGHILADRIPEWDQFGVGIMGFSDKSGNGVLQNNYAALSLAYHKALDENGWHQIGVGFQGTYLNKRLDVANLKLEDMLQSDGFTGVTGESFTSQQMSVSYIDANAGLFYNGSSDGENNFYIGASVYHLNQHKETFLKGEYFLKPRTTIQAGGRIPVGYLNSIHVSGNVSTQAGATNTVLGGAFALNANANEDDPTILYAGAWYRLGDAAIPYLGLEWGEFHLGATYDVNTSSLKPGSNMRGGTEISVIYTRKPRDPNAKKLNCPKF